MNDIHMQQIFKHYIDNFEKLNDSEHMEYYKWQIVKKFRPMMDEALKSDSISFPERLMEVKKITSNLVDSYTQPFYGLVKFAEQEPDTVRGMFQNLFTYSGAIMEEKQRAVSDFLRKSHELRDKYYPDSFLYKDDMHSVTTYLFLYDPDHNYIFKSSHALIFADCIEFYDDWGSGDSVKLDVYYRMCDQIADAIKKSQVMLKTDASRFENGWGVDSETFASDAEKHILVFDLIYCCSTYGLFDGIIFSRPKTKEKQLIQEKRDKAARFSKELEEAKENFEKLEEALVYLDCAYGIGTLIRHKKYGEGKVSAKHGTTIEVQFPDGAKKLGIVLSAANDIIVSMEEGYAERMEVYRPLLKKESTIKSALEFAEKNFTPYAEYLESY